MYDLIPLASPEKLLFWSAPVQDSEFAPEDPLALDYLAQQVGLFLLPTLTTRSSRAQAFAIVLYGLHLAEKGVEHFGLPPDDEVRRTLFERWERFWAMAVLESRGGVLGRGDPDAMRGVRGAVRAWFGGERPLPLDYALISRQQELGSLGAYLAPLRLAGLVIPGTLRPSPAAGEILDAFWDEPGQSARVARYASFAMEALDPERSKVPRKYGNLTLARVGTMSRLTSLVARGRVEQQARLYRALILAARGTTLPVANLVEASTRDEVFKTRDVLSDAIDGRWGPLDQGLLDLLRTARAFGDMMQALLATFDRAYRALFSTPGWHAARSEIAAQALGPEALERLQRTAGALLDSPEAGKIGRLPAHGPAFLRLIRELREASPDAALERIFEYHYRVQRERRRGDAWVRDREGQLTLLLTTYSARPDAPRYPSFKLDVLRTLLVDLGRLPSDRPPEVEAEQGEEVPA